MPGKKLCCDYRISLQKSKVQTPVEESCSMCGNIGEVGDVFPVETPVVVSPEKDFDLNSTLSI